jgi:quinol monooxygenase YgiN
LYQLVRDQQGQYFYLELHSDHEALETHSKNMGAKGATPLDKIKYGKSPLQIFPVVDGVLHECEAIIANVITIPTTDSAAFEAATAPALAAYDATEPGALAYLLCKMPDSSTYYFVELFKDQAVIDTHGASDAFKIQENEEASWRCKGQR